MARAAASTSEICTAGPGEHYCQQCGQLFCGSCKSSRLRAKSCKSHTFVSGPNINLEDTFLCIEHDESFLFYCHDCETPVCRICSVKKHSRHLMTDLNESTEKLKSELVNQIESKLKTSRLSIKKIEKGTKTYRKEVKAVIKTITEEGDYWKSLIDKKVKALIKEVQDDEQEQMSNMFAFTQAYRRVVENCQQWQNNITKTETTAGVRLYQKMKQLKTDVDQIALNQVPSAPFVSYRKNNSSDSEIDTLFGELQFCDTGQIDNQDSFSDTEQIDNQDSFSHKPMNTRHYYTCEMCGTDQASTLPRKTVHMFGDDIEGLEMECNNRKCSRYKEISWHDFKR